MLSRSYEGNTIGVLSGLDRLVLRGTLRGLAFTAGMMNFLNGMGVLLKDFGAYVERTSQRLKEASCTDYQQRPEGIRVKHQLKQNSVKIYDKQGSVLRVETTIDDPADFRVFRPHHAEAPLVACPRHLTQASSHPPLPVVPARTADHRRRASIPTAHPRTTSKARSLKNRAGKQEIRR